METYKNLIYKLRVNYNNIINNNSDKLHKYYKDRHRNTSEYELLYTSLLVTYIIISTIMSLCCVFIKTIYTHT